MGGGVSRGRWEQASRERLGVACRLSTGLPPVSHTATVYVCVCVHACAHNTAITVARAITYICIAAAPLPAECVCVSGRRLIDLR